MDLNSYFVLSSVWHYFINYYLQFFILLIFLYLVCSYSSVSVSPTQFSPTQSPIQPRHIQRNFHEYTVAEETNGYEEKIAMSDIGQQHGITSGISRQQLINRFVFKVMN